MVGKLKGGVRMPRRVAIGQDTTADTHVGSGRVGSGRLLEIVG